MGPPRRPARPADSMAVAISRAELAAAKPWLIPELYNAAAEDANDRAGLGDEPRALRRRLRSRARADRRGHRRDADSVRPRRTGDVPRFSGGDAGGHGHPPGETGRGCPDHRARKEKPEDKEATYTYRFSIATNGSAMGPVADYRLSERVKYWSGVFHHSLKECVALKPNSDMGLCQLVRLLYRYGTLPQGWAPTRDLTWRRRLPPDETFTRFFAQRATAVGGNAELRRRLQTGETKLRIILEETATHPRSPDPSFSPLAGEILKQGLLSYKYWLDEKPRALENERLNKVKTELGYGDDEVDHEMEFWSENHYIMFASSEYLLGQLWQDETFQPCQLFVDAGDTTGARTGAQRRDRGRARVLKWLNNRLMFGWMEFNSSGYYREHLWALLNLVDFALDEEVRTKATMAVDLMLFDVTRYLHRGAMGAAGGRSQFKSKSHGFDNGADRRRGDHARRQRRLQRRRRPDRRELRLVDLRGAAGAARDRRGASRVPVHGPLAGVDHVRRVGEVRHHLVAGLRDQGLADAWLCRQAGPLLPLARRGQQGDRAHPRRLWAGRGRHRLLLGDVGVLQQAGGAQQPPRGEAVRAQEGRRVQDARACCSISCSSSRRRRAP